MQLSLTWWNTSLGPNLNNGKVTSQEKKVVFDMIEILLNQENTTFLALGETYENFDSELIKQNQISKDYKIISCTDKVGRTSFDSCIIYNSSKLNLFGEYVNIIKVKNRKTSKVAQKFVFYLDEMNDFLYIFVSHWPSRLHVDENHVDRSLLANKLREEVECLEDSNLQNNYIVLMGDYNDEPYNRAMYKELLATKDRNLAISRKELLYNPFWRHLSEKNSYSYQINSQSATLNDSVPGSYYHKNNTLSKWHTFDQIILSSDFLGKSDWYLNEEKSGIFSPINYKNKVLDNSTIFDHFPVNIILEKEVNNV